MVPPALPPLQTEETWTGGLRNGPHRTLHPNGKLAAAGLSATIFYYVAINLMMVMGLAPVVGIPLPLVSFGGTAMLTVMLCIGVLMSIERQGRTRRSHFG